MHTLEPPPVMTNGFYMLLRHVIKIKYLIAHLTPHCRNLKTSHGFKIEFSEFFGKLDRNTCIFILLIMQSLCNLFRCIVKSF